ncbi:MAG: hypothetical protein ACTSYI_08590 [Promethearchaeota archaeon]
MSSKTTVAIKQNVRKKIKKLGALLDITQGEVIERALKLLEVEVINKSSLNGNIYHVIEEGNQIGKDDPIDIQKILDDASRKVYAMDPDHKRIQEKLQKGNLTIDDIIASEWISGL